MRVTKKPKRVNLIEKKITCSQYSYICPVCKTTHIGNIITKRVTRFLCDCGQELIVNARIKGAKE